MADTCVKHTFEIAKDVCRVCQNSYCEECLVYSFGPKKPPYCVTCALAAAGIRHAGAAPNPRLQKKKGLFGRKHIVEDLPAREPSFDDIQIHLPEQLLANPAMMKVTRRTVSPELVDAVAKADGGSLGSLSAMEPAEIDTEVVDDSAVSATDHESLAGWAASLAEPEADGTSTLAEDEPHSIAPWPEDTSIGSGSAF